MQSFGIAALVFAIIGIIVPFGYFVSTVSALLAFFSSGRGTALGVASVIINIINIYMLSPTLLLIVVPARIARKTQEMSEQEMLFLALVLIQIAALSFIAGHWIFSSIEENEESESRIMIKNAMKSFSVLILGVVSIFSIGIAGKTAFAIKKPQQPYEAATAVPEKRRHEIKKDGDNFFKQNEIKPQVQENNAKVYKITDKNGQVIYTNDPAKAAAQKGYPVELKPLETVRLK